MDSSAQRSPLKAPPLREPGESIRGRTVDLVMGRLLPTIWLTTIGVTLMISSWAYQALGWHASSSACALVTMALTTAMVLQFYFVSRKVKALQLGRDGELVVGQFLEQQLLAKGARIVHDVPADGFNVDHVVIAPQGIFAIETKTRSKPRYRKARVTFAADGTLCVAGYKPERDPITQVQLSSRWLSQLLTDGTGQSIHVRGVVVFPGWFVEPMNRDWLDGANPWVLEPKSLPGFLKRERRVLDDREVIMFSNHLNRYIRTRQDAARKK